ncbi:hypothetical protein Tco_0722904 [Tanacetum coccineum]
MMTYLKNTGDYKHSELKGKTYEEIHELYERQQKRIQDFIPMDSEKEVIKDSGKKDDSSSKPAGGSRLKTLARKRTGKKKSKESAKRQKLEDTVEEQESIKSDEEAAADYKQEKEELRMWLTIVPDEEETVDPIILSAKYPVVDWESQNLGNVDMEDLHVYKIIKADGNTSYHKSLSSMLRKVHSLLMDGTLTCFNMLVEKRYPLIKEMLQKMLNWKLEAEAESTMAFELLKFIKGGLLGILDFYNLVLLVQLNTASFGKSNRGIRSYDKINSVCFLVQGPSTNSLGTRISWRHPWDPTLGITLVGMSMMANATPIVTTITKTTNKEKASDAAPRVNIQDFCEEHYEDILPIIMEKARRDKRKEVQNQAKFWRELQEDPKRKGELLKLEGGKFASGIPP